MASSYTPQCILDHYPNYAEFDRTSETPSGQFYHPSTWQTEFNAHASDEYGGPSDDWFGSLPEIVRIGCGIDLEEPRVTFAGELDPAWTALVSADQGPLTISTEYGEQFKSYHELQPRPRRNEWEPSDFNTVVEAEEPSVTEPDMIASLPRASAPEPSAYHDRVGESVSPEDSSSPTDTEDHDESFQSPEGLSESTDRAGRRSEELPSGFGSHTEPFSCLSCGKSFRQKGHLTAFLRNLWKIFRGESQPED